jgi:hypothetical protein
VNIPEVIRVGDTVKWRDDAAVDPFGNPISSGSGWVLTYYIRFNRNNHGATAVGTAYGDGWEFTLSAATTGGFHEDDVGYWQAVASKGTEKYTLGSGSFEVEPNLFYTGTPSAVDGRSQARKDLEACQAAIRALMTGGAVQEYRIGTRSLKKYDLSELLQLEAKLKADVVREEAAESIANGRGNPYNLFVRFS